MHLRELGMRVSDAYFSRFPKRGGTSQQRIDRELRIGNRDEARREKLRAELNAKSPTSR